MTNDRPSDIESRMNRVEVALVSTGEFLQQASALVQENAGRIDRVEGAMNRVEVALARTGEFLQQASALVQENAGRMDRVEVAIDRLTDRIDSLTAASERHDRILDYLLGQGRDSGNS